MSNTDVPVAVALLYQTNQQGGPLREALKELGANVVYEAYAADVDRDALENSRARVVVVNLDPESDAYLEQVYDLLDKGDYEVIFNEGQVSAQLQGWDHARWARHLAAKILHRPEITTPPRPPGAQAVPTPAPRIVPSAVVPPPPKPEQRAAPIVSPPSALRAATAPPASSAPLLDFALDDAFPAAAAPSPTPVKPSSVEDALDLDFASALDDFANAGDAPAPLPIPTKSDSVDFGGKLDQFAQGRSVLATPSAGTSDFGAELDALFAQSSKSAGGAQKPATPVADFPDFSDVDIDMLGGTIESSSTSVESDFLSHLTDEDVTQPEGITVEELGDEFPAIFDRLDDAAANIPNAPEVSYRAPSPPAAPPTPAPAAKKSTSTPSLPPDWGLEPLDEFAAAVPQAAPPKAEDFGIKKVSATQFLAPEVERSSAKQQEAMPKEAFGLQLMPIEEAVAPEIQAPVSRESRLEEASSTSKKKPLIGAGSSRIERVWVLGASIGGPEAVREFLGALPARFPALFVLVQHMGEEFVELMASQLAKATALTVRSPSHGERVGNGEIVVVPTTHRLQVDAEGVVVLTRMIETLPYSPSIDQVLRDVADKFGSKSRAIVFSGMAHDAIEGSIYLAGKGGIVWAQDPKTCVVSSMVDGAREAGVVSFIGSPRQLAEKILQER